MALQGRQGQTGRGRRMRRSADLARSTVDYVSGTIWHAVVSGVIQNSKSAQHYEGIKVKRVDI